MCGVIVGQQVCASLTCLLGQSSDWSRPKARAGQPVTHSLNPGYNFMTSILAILSQDGEWTLCQPGAGAPLTLGTSSTAAAEVAPRPVPPLAPMVDLGRELFGHLPSSMPGDATEAAALPLFHVSLVALEGGGSGERSRERSGGKGGCVLGLRISHMVADYSTLRCALHHLARAYSGRPLAAFDVPAPAVPLVATLAARPPPLGAQPYNYLPLPPDVGAQLAALAAAPQLQGLVLHVPPARLAEHKAQALAEAAAAAAGAAGLGMGTEAAAAAVDSGGGEGGDATGGEGNEPDWVSTDDALMAWLWRTLAALPCRRGAVTPFNRGLNMRGRLPAAVYEGGHQPRWIYGNLATSSFTPALDAPALSLGQVALELRRTVARCVAGSPGHCRSCSSAPPPWLCTVPCSCAGMPAWQCKPAAAHPEVLSPRLP